jgi:uncharacterized protein
MYCPMCTTPLRAVERQGIPIDYCTHCEGIWLDRGELDELIRREAQEMLIQGQQSLTKRRNARAYDHVDQDAPTTTPTHRFLLHSAREIRR